MKQDLNWFDRKPYRTMLMLFVVLFIILAVYLGSTH